MGREYSSSLFVPFVLLGLPLEYSENPFLAVPSECRVRVSVSVSEEGNGIEANIFKKDINELVEEFIKNLISEFQLNIGIKLKIESDHEDRCTSSGIYSIATSTALYYTAKYFGEPMSVPEIIEYARMLDPFNQISGWTGVIDSLRYSALTGKAVVYRNDEEFGEIGELHFELRSFGGESVRQKWSRDDMGSDVYGAFIHTIGTLVLEGAVRIRENAGGSPNLEPLLYAHNSLARLFWDITPGTTHISPGLPGVFEIVEIDVA